MFYIYMRNDSLQNNFKKHSYYLKLTQYHHRQLSQSLAQMKMVLMIHKQVGTYFVSQLMLIAEYLLYLNVKINLSFCNLYLYLPTLKLLKSDVRLLIQYHGGGHRLPVILVPVTMRVKASNKKSNRKLFLNFIWKYNNKYLKNIKPYVHR